MLSAERIMQRCDALARHSELAGGLTRVFLSPENRAANELVLGWMREAGMQAKLIQPSISSVAEIGRAHV